MDDEERDYRRRRSAQEQEQEWRYQQWRVEGGPASGIRAMNGCGDFLPMLVIRPGDGGAFQGQCRAHRRNRNPQRRHEGA